MKVIATARGLYRGMIRDPGDVFEVAEGVTATWFEPVDKGIVKPAKAAAASKSPAAKG